jgi:hypothetical protein
MLSKEDSRKLAQLERELRRDDPALCARMRDGLPARRRVPASLLLAACVIWTAAVILAIVGWWGAAVVGAVWGTVIVIALAHRRQPERPSPGPGFPPAW